MAGMSFVTTMAEWLNLPENVRAVTKRPAEPDRTYQPPPDKLTGTGDAAYKYLTLAELTAKEEQAMQFQSYVLMTHLKPLLIEWLDRQGVTGLIRNLHWLTLLTFFSAGMVGGVIVMVLHMRRIL
jgi:hypothetical protein